MSQPEVLVAADRNTIESKTNYCHLDDTSAYGCLVDAVLQNNTKLFKCTICDYRSTNSRNVRRHMSARHGIEVEPALKRGKRNVNSTASISKANDYRLDDSTSTDGCSSDAVPKNVHECTVCDYKSTNLSNVRRHTRARHDFEFTPTLSVKRNGNPTASRTNDNTLDASTSVDGYSADAVPKNLRECTVCDYKSTNLCNVRRHMLARHGIQLQRINKNWNSTTSKSNDYRLDNSASVDGCSVEAVPKNITKLHECTVCDYKSKNPCNARRHMLALHGIEVESPPKRVKSNPLECDICGFKATGEAKFKIHYRKHTGEKPYGCDICGKRTTTQGHLREHMLIHTGEKKFECDLCDYKTNQAYALQAHKLKHTGQKPFECDMCDYKSIRLNNLNSHKLMHTKTGKIYKCKLCSYESVRQSNLNTHKLTHATVKRFACDECPFRTMLNSSLRKHKASHMRKRQKLSRNQSVVVTSAPPSTLDEDESAYIGEMPLECVIKTEPIQHLDQNIN